MSAHTPWTFNNAELDSDRDIVDSKGNTILCNECYYPYINLKIEEWRLVAAAPEMFELLKCVNAEREYYAINQLIQKIEGNSE